jgi:CheY-like chemotaxis protein
MGGGPSVAGDQSEAFRSIAMEYDKFRVEGMDDHEEEMDFTTHEAAAHTSTHTSTHATPAPSPCPKTAASPRAAAYKAAAETAAATVAATAPGQVQDGANGVVLLIDDSPVAAKVASKVLQQLKFEVLTANSARAGYDVLQVRFEDIKIIFLDVMMPEVDGVECLQWIKENPKIAHIPVYMLSGLEDNMVLDVCTEHGAEGMILKPLNVKIVKGIVKDHNIEMKGVDMSNAVTSPRKGVKAAPKEAGKGAVAAVVAGVAAVVSSLAGKVSSGAETGVEEDKKG